MRGLLVLAIAGLWWALPVEAETLTVTVVALPQCSDTIDNDGDTFTDYPNDPECTGTDDTNESTPPPEGGGGGGGGGGSSSSDTSTQAIFRGKAYPGSKVTILKDAQVAASVVASPDGNFDVTVTGLASGTYTFSVYGTDRSGVQSGTHTFTVSLAKGVTNVVTGIFLPPTISVDKKEVRYGDVLRILGQTHPQAEVTVFVNSAHEVVKKVAADASGAWLLNFDTTEIEYGRHTTQSRAAKSGEISPLSGALTFTVGTNNVPWAATGSLRGDANGDSSVNIVDFSIMAYWYRRSNPPEAVDINADGQVTIVDFSILAFNWNG